MANFVVNCLLFTLILLLVAASLTASFAERLTTSWTDQGRSRDS